MSVALSESFQIFFPTIEAFNLCLCFHHVSRYLFFSIVEALEVYANFVPGAHHKNDCSTEVLL